MKDNHNTLVQHKRREDYTNPARTLIAGNMDGSRKQYILLIATLNIVIWSLALLYLRYAPQVFTSQWTAILPSTSSNTNVNLPGIGTTSTEQNSPYSNSAEDPRENYKYLAESEPVLKTAAEHLKMSAEEFGVPRVEIIDNTTLMNFELSGETPSQAKRKASALYTSLELYLNRLRSSEASRQEEEFHSGFSDTKEKLARAQKRLADFKRSSGMVSSEQVTQLSGSIENLRNQKAGILSQWRQTSAQLGQLSKNMNLTSVQAADAFTLQTDPQFQQNLKDYSDSSANLAVLNSQLEPSHPTVVNEKAKQKSAQTALLKRSKSLLGQSVNLNNLSHLNLKNNSGSAGSAAREDLFKQVVTTKVNQQGLEKQVQELDRQIAQLEGRLSGLAQKESKLVELERDVKISEAVFSSTLAKLDTNKVNPLSSYPRFQIFTEPSLPVVPSSPKTLFVLLGTTLGSILITIGILLLWQRERRSSVYDFAEPSEDPFQHKYHENTDKPELNNFSKPVSLSYYSQNWPSKVNDYGFKPNQFSLSTESQKNFVSVNGISKSSNIKEYEKKN